MRAPAATRRARRGETTKTTETTTVTKAKTIKGKKENITKEDQDLRDRRKTRISLILFPLIRE